MKHRTKLLLTLVLILAVIATVAAATTQIANILIPVTVKPSVEVVSYPQSLSLRAGTNTSIPITLQNYNLNSTAIYLSFALNDSNYQALYVTFSPITFTIATGSQQVVSYVYVTPDAPAATLTLTVGVSLETSLAPTSTPTPTTTPAPTPTISPTLNWIPITAGSATVSGNSSLYSFTSDGNQADYSILYAPFPSTNGSFNVSYDVQALTLGEFAFVASADPMPTFGSTNSVMLEMVALQGQGKGWQISRWTSHWTWDTFAYPQPDVWYHVVIQVTSQPFTFSATVYLNGSVFGNATVSDMSNISYSSLKSFGFECWAGACTYQISNFTIST